MVQRLQTAVAVFCTACICAELVGRLLGNAWSRQCIKAAAGLYILVALFRALPGIRAGAASLRWPEVPASSFGTMEQTVLQEAQRDLAGTLEARIAEETGLDVRLDIRLETSQNGVQAVQTEIFLPAGCTRQEQAAIQELLCGELGTDPDAMVWSVRPEGG